jgi:carbon starvation protein
MLLEGVLGVIAIATVMMAGSIGEGGPVATFGQGFGKFAGLVGIPSAWGVSLGILAVNCFLLTTLDTAARLGRYQLQELFNMRLDRYSATIVGVASAFLLLVVRTGDTPVWLYIWEIFGASNQLVAALALLGVSVWVIKGLKKRAWFLTIPMAFMLVTTFAALLLLIKSRLLPPNPEDRNLVMVGIAVVLLALAIMLLKEAYTALRRPGPPVPQEAGPGTEMEG